MPPAEAALTSGNVACAEEDARFEKGCEIALYRCACESGLSRPKRERASIRGPGVACKKVRLLLERFIKGVCINPCPHQRACNIPDFVHHVVLFLQ